MKTLPLFLILAASVAQADSLTLQENYPGAAGAPNYRAGGYVSTPLGGGYTRITPVTGAGGIVDNNRPSYTVHEPASLPPMPSDDPDGSRRREWLMNQ